MPAVAIAGAALGAVSGAMPKTTDQKAWLDSGQAGAGELAGLAGRDRAYSELGDLTNAGPGQSDVQASVKGQRDLASMLRDMASTGGLPSQGDISAAGGFADQIFNSRQVGLNQSFIQQNTQAQRLSAQLGRPVDDPILQAKLRTGFMNQQDSLNADKTGYGAQLALALPGQRLQYATQGANVLSGLASQAFSNRSALLAAGSQIANQDQNWRLANANRFGSVSTGGGVGGAIDGAISGFGKGLGIGNMMGGGSGGGQETPSNPGYDTNGNAVQGGFGPTFDPNSNRFFSNDSNYQTPYDAAHENLGGTTRSLGSVTMGNSPFGAGASWASPQSSGYGNFLQGLAPMQNYGR